MLPFIVHMKNRESHEEWLKLVEAEKLEFEPGTQWKYDNSGFYLLGLVVEKASGEPYERFLKDNIFTPLNMKSACANDTDTVMPGRAEGYRWDSSAFKNISQVDMSWPFSAGALVCSVNDFAKWAAALYDGRLLKPESYKEMYTPAKLKDGSPQNYGFGWVVDEFRTHPILWHSGGIPGFVTDFVRWPKDNLSVIVFTNCDTCDPHEIATAISGLYLPSIKPLSDLRPQEDPDARVTGEVRELIDHFSKGDSKVDGATTAMQKVLNPSTQPIFKDITDHMKVLLYLDGDPPRSDGSRTVYYKVQREDGSQYLTVGVSPDGKISGLKATGVAAD
jgi:CubicO group peptidase (beta-lactamase class C family)